MYIFHEGPEFAGLLNDFRIHQTRSTQWLQQQQTQISGKYGSSAKTQLQNQ